MSLVWEVTARYGFNAPTEWAYDMTFMLYGTFFMVGSAWTLQRGGHIRTDSFYSKWSQRTQARVDLACYLIFFFPAIAIFAWLGWEYFRQVVRAERADRHEPLAADRLAVQVHDARSLPCCCCCRASPSASAAGCGRSAAMSDRDRAADEGEVVT